MGKPNSELKAAIEDAKQAALDYHTALQRQRMNKQRLRKAQDHQKFQNGGMIQQVGLNELPRELLLGALLLIKRMLEDPDWKAEALKRGKRALADQAAKKTQKPETPEVFIAFDEAPPEELRAALKVLKLTFRRRRMEWRGPANITLVVRTVLAFNWDQHVVRSGYVPPPQGPAK